MIKKFLIHANQCDFKMDMVERANRCANELGELLVAIIDYENARITKEQFISKVAEEGSDVLNTVITLMTACRLDIEKCVDDKLRKDFERYGKSNINKFKA